MVYNHENCRLLYLGTLFFVANCTTLCTTVNMCNTSFIQDPEDLCNVNQQCVSSLDSTMDALEITKIDDVTKPAVRKLKK